MQHAGDKPDKKTPPSPKRRLAKWLIGIVVLAACIVLAVMLWHQTAKEPDAATKDLMLLDAPSEIHYGVGYEALLVFDISELANTNNPWTMKANVDTLPVYKNLAPLHSSGVPLSGMSVEEMKTWARQIAEQLELDSSRLEFTTQTETLGENVGEPVSTTYEYGLIAATEGAEIDIECTGRATIWFEPALDLPPEYRITWEATTTEEATAALRYLEERYRDVVDMEKPAQTLIGEYGGGSYDINGIQRFDYTLFENAGNLTDQIRGYNFHRVTFINDHEDKLWGIRIYRPDLSEKIGDYPIITPEEAEELLLQKHYITSVPYPIAGPKSIAMVELVYHTSGYNELYMPYYRFYVELAEEPNANQVEGLKTFGAYYVPAVRSEYLNELPLWSGDFN